LAILNALDEHFLVLIVVGVNVLHLGNSFDLAVILVVLQLVLGPAGFV
jgi:hypothetical protein